MERNKLELEPMNSRSRANTSDVVHIINSCFDCEEEDSVTETKPSKSSRQLELGKYGTADFKIEQRRGRSNLDDRWPLSVHLYLSIYHLCDVNTTNHTFSVQGKIRMEWQITQDECNRYNAAHENLTFFKPDIVPQFEFRNQVDYSQEAMRYESGSEYDVYQVGREWYIQCGFEFHSSFAEPLELENFPFDVQHLKIIIESRHLDKNHIQLKPMISFPACSLDMKYNNCPEWKVDGICFDYEPQGNDSCFSNVTLQICISRRYEAVLFRIIYFLVMISGLSVCIFSMNPIENQDERLGHAITFMLSGIAFQFVINQVIPDIPYITLLDQVCIFSFSFISACVVETALIRHLSKIWPHLSDEDLLNIDQKFMYGFLCSYSMVDFCYILQFVRYMLSDKKGRSDSWFQGMSLIITILVSKICLHGTIGERQFKVQWWMKILTNR